ncbi:MAG: N-acetylneuraminate synthase, partial [Segetibacter sp.]|nr:N-acetylneuraminate synthase [Segetibacter sp.]
VKGVREIRTCVKNEFSKNEQAENVADLKQLFGKSLCVNKELPANHTITLEDLEAKKPFGHGIPPSEYNAIIGKRLKKALYQWDFLNHQDLQNL